MGSGGEESGGEGNNSLGVVELPKDIVSGTDTKSTYQISTFKLNLWGSYARNISETQKNPPK